MKRIRIAILRLSLLAAAVTMSACADDVALGGTGVLLTTGEDTSSTTTEASTTEGDSGLDESGEGGGEGGGFPCSMQGMFDDYEAHLPDVLVAEDVDQVDPSVICDFDELVDDAGVDDDRLDTNITGGIDTFDVYVYRPADNLGDWPDAPPHPTIFFAPSRGGTLVNSGGDLTNPDDHLYWPFFEPLTQAGFVVVAI